MTTSSSERQYKLFREDRGGTDTAEPAEDELYLRVVVMPTLNRQAGLFRTAEGREPAVEWLTDPADRARGMTDLPSEERDGYWCALAAHRLRQGARRAKRVYIPANLEPWAVHWHRPTAYQVESGKSPEVEYVWATSEKVARAVAADQIRAWIADDGNAVARISKLV